MMKSLMYNGPRDTTVVEILEPTPQPREVKIEVMYSGICGSDVHGYTGSSGRRTPPMIMGHEFSGIVTEVGAEVKKFSVGDRVTAQPVLFCGTCRFCVEGKTNICENRRNLGVMTTNGSNCEFICVPEQNVFRVADNIDMQAATLIEPFSVVYHALQRVRPIEGKEVLVVGTGTIGLLLVKLLRFYGPKSITVVDMIDSRLELAELMGADLIINVKKEKVEDALRTHGLLGNIDLAIECVGASATARQTVDLAKIGGKVLWVGNAARMAEIDMQKVVTQEVTITGSYAFSNEDFQEALDLMASGKVDLGGIISKVVPLSEAAAAFETLVDGDPSLVKVLVALK